MEIKQILGLGGDVSNFVAAVLLAWDPMHRKQVFLRQRADAALPQDVVFEDEHGKILPRKDELERHLVSGESLRSRWGYALLFVGFSLLLLARSLEIWPDWYCHLLFGH